MTKRNKSQSTTKNTGAKTNKERPEDGVRVDLSFPFDKSNKPAVPVEDSQRPANIDQTAEVQAVANDCEDDSKSANIPDSNSTFSVSSGVIAVCEPGADAVDTTPHVFQRTADEESLATAEDAPELRSKDSPEKHIDLGESAKNISESDSPIAAPADSARIVSTASSSPAARHEYEDISPGLDIKESSNSMSAQTASVTHSVPRKGEKIFSNKNIAQRWLLATNSKNLFYMLGAGLVMPPQGFSFNGNDKYYPDSLEIYPGWIPLFWESIPKEVLDRGSSSRGAKACIVEVNLKSVHGQVQVLAEDGTAKELNFPNALEGNETTLFIRAPLSIHCLEKVFVSQEKDRQAIIDASGNYSNVLIGPDQVVVNSGLFVKEFDLVWHHPNHLPDSEVALEVPFAAGAVMAMLGQLANRGELSSQLCRIAFEAGSIKGAPPFTKALFAPLYDWMHSGQVNILNDIPTDIFWGIMSSIAKSHFLKEPKLWLDVILDYMQVREKDLDKSLRSKFSDLQKELSDIAKSSREQTNSETFSKHPGIISKPLILFFLRQSCGNLLRYHNDALQEEHYLAAALLASASDSWLGLPSSLREFSGMQQAAITHRMAAMAHRLAKTGMEFGDPPPRPVSLRELFLPRGVTSSWDQYQQDAAINLARKLNWECFETTVSLPSGKKYLLTVESGEVHLHVKGSHDLVNLHHKIDQDAFFLSLGNLDSISTSLEYEVRTKLGSI